MSRIGTGGAAVTISGPLATGTSMARIRSLIRLTVGFYPRNDEGPRRPGGAPAEIRCRSGAGAGVLARRGLRVLALRALAGGAAGAHGRGGLGELRAATAATTTTMAWHWGVPPVT